MKDVCEAMLMAGLAGSIVFLLIILSTLMGAFGGWVTGLLFSSELRLLSDAMGIDAEPWQLGAIFAFVGAFFKSNLKEK